MQECKLSRIIDFLNTLIAMLERPETVILIEGVRNVIVIDNKIYSSDIGIDIKVAERVVVARNEIISSPEKINVKF